MSKTKKWSVWISSHLAHPGGGVGGLVFHLSEEGVPALGDDLPGGRVGDEDVGARVGALVAQRPCGDVQVVPGRGLGEGGEGDGHVDGDLEVVAVGDGGGGADLVHQGHHGARGQAPGRRVLGTARRNEMK